MGRRSLTYLRTRRGARWGRFIVNSNRLVGNRLVNIADVFARGARYGLGGSLLGVCIIRWRRR
jgi:hypothetical protein